VSPCIGSEKRSDSIDVCGRIQIGHDTQNQLGLGVF